MKKLLILFLFTGMFSCEKSTTAVLNGTVENIEAKKIFLVTIDQDPRFDSIIEIPVVDNKFTFTTEIQQPEAFKLFVNQKQGSVVPVFLEPGESSILISDKNLTEHSIQSGGKLIETYNSYQILNEKIFSEGIRLKKNLDSLIKMNEYHSPQMLNVLKQLGETKDFGVKNKLYEEMDSLYASNKDVSEKGLEVKLALENLNTDYFQILYDFIDKENSLVAYYFLLKELKYRPENFKNIYNQERIKKFSELFPNHKYTNLAEAWLKAAIDVQIGKPFVDFTAQDLNNNNIQFSEKLNGKYVLLDLWATWCGPCIAKSEEMVPVYEKYKNQNFEIIGVAGEYDSKTKLMKFLENNNWPWQQLVDLDHKNKIWEKYGIDGSGGALFLIDPEGNIAAINPEPEELIKILEKNKESVDSPSA